MSQAEIINQTRYCSHCGKEIGKYEKICRELY